MSRLTKTPLFPLLSLHNINPRPYQDPLDWIEEADESQERKTVRSDESVNVGKPEFFKCKLQLPSDESDC